MSLAKYESQVKYLPLTQEEAYNRFGDLRNLGAVKEKLDDPSVQAKMAEQLPADKLDEARRQLENMSFDRDAVSLATPFGQITLRVTEREEPKLLKFSSEGSPVPLNVWIQLLPADEGCKMRVTVGAEVNMFMKGIVAKPLQQAADGLAEILCVVS